MKQQYNIKPAEIEVYRVFDNKTDVILRKNIQQQNIEELPKDKEHSQLIWTCEEIQSRFNYIINKEEIKSNIANWWDKLEKNNKVTFILSPEERLTILEDENARLRQQNEETTLILADLLYG